MKRVNLLILLTIFLFYGCASVEIADREKQLQATLDPLIGRTKQEIILAFGVPTEQSNYAGIEIYKYYQSYGVKGNAYAYQSSPYLPTVVSDNSRETYDIVNLYFKDDIFIKWDGYIQR